MSTLYFAYGSNMDFNQLDERKIFFKFLGVAKLINYELRFNKVASNKPGVGYANIMHQEGAIVEGLLLNVENLEALDKFEGYPNHYEKSEMEVVVNDKLVTAIVYIAKNDKTKSGLKPLKWYLDKLLSAKEFLSKEYFENLKRVITID